MLKDFVEELANNPGSATTIQLAGAPAGRRPFVSAASFSSGETVAYGIVSGAMFEYGIGTVTAGTPNTLSRTTVLGNSSGTTSRLNFTGACNVYNELPSAVAPRRDPNTGKLPMSELPYETAWNVLDKAFITTAVGAVDFTLPSAFVRFRLEWSEFTGAATAQMFARVNQGAGFLAGASDYGRSLGVFGSGVNTAGGGLGAEIICSDGTAEGVFGAMEFVRPASGARAAGTVDSSYVRASDGVRARLVGGFQVIPTSPLTAVRLGFVGNSVAGGRVRLLGGLP